MKIIEKENMELMQFCLEIAKLKQKAYACHLAHIQPIRNIDSDNPSATTEDDVIWANFWNDVSIKLTETLKTVVDFKDKYE